MGTSFRIAIAVSTLIHSALFAPLYKTFAPAAADKQVVVDYIKIKEPEVKMAALKERPARTVETPKVQLANNVKMAPGRDVSEKSEALKKEARELAKRQSPLRNSRDYINYYQLIREKIRQALKTRYTKYYGQGDVSLIFMLNSNGSLAAVDVDGAVSARDSALAQLAVMSVKEAAPFPGFPRELSVPKMSFDLTVSFKKD